MDKIKVCVATCLKYESAALLFSELVEKRNSDFKFIYLTDSRLEFESSQIICKDDISWSLRIARSLRLIDSEYILFMLEDYYLLDLLDKSVIEGILNKFSPLYLRLVNTPFAKNYTETGLNRIEKDKNYGINLQISVWNRDFLIKLLTEINDNPWKTETSLSRYFETDGLNYNEAYWCDLNSNMINGVIKGKWNREFISHAKSIGININKSQLTSMTVYENFIYLTKVKFGSKIQNKKIRKFLKYWLGKIGMEFVKGD